MTTKSWEEVLILAKDFVDVISKDVLFDKPFNNTMDCIVTTNVREAFHYATEQLGDFPEWQDVTSAYGNFPESFAYPDEIDLELQGRAYFNLEGKDYNGVDEGWDYTLHDMMMEHIEYIFYCYANDHFPPIWEKILQAYLNGGLPCGWSDFPPKGKLVVFSKG